MVFRHEFADESALDTIEESERLVLSVEGARRRDGRACGVLKARTMVRAEM